MIYKMELSDSVDDMIFELLEVPIEDKDVTGIADNTTIDGNVFRDYLWLKKQWTQKWSIMCQDEYNRLRGFWLRQFGNAEVPFYRLFYGDNVYEDKNTFTVNGFVQIENDAPLYSPLSLTHLYGNATQETIQPLNLYDVFDTVGGTVQNITVDADGWATCTINNTSGTGYAYGFLWTNNLVALQTNTNYAIVMEVKSKSGSGIIDPTQGSSVNSQMTANVHYDFANISAGQTYVFTQKTKADFSGTSQGLRTVVSFNAGQSGSITFRLSVLADTSITPQTFSYLPFVGSSPSPNPDYPQTVNVVSGAQEVKITGKNLFDKSAIASGKIVNRTTGALDNNNSYGATDFIKVVAGESYSFTGFNYWYSAGYDINRNYVGNLDNSATITIPSGVAFIRSSLLLTNLDTAQFEAGQATAYEPYQSQSQEINLGKNLAGGYSSDVQRNSGNLTWNNKADGTITVSAGTSSGEYSLVQSEASGNRMLRLQAGTYTLSGGTNAVQLSFRIKDGADNSTSASTGKITFTLNSETQGFIRALVGNGVSVSAQTLYPQLEVGSQATPYAPYKTPIELAKIGNYTDGFRIIDGTWYIHKEVGKVVFVGDNSEGWWLQSGTTNQMRAPISDAFTGAPLMSDYFHESSSESELGAMQIYMAGYIRAMSNQTSANAFKTWLSTHNTTVYYALATPTDTEITDSELIEQLNHIYSLYGGVNNLMLIPSGGAQGEIAVKYRLNYEEETDIIPSTPVVLTLTDGGVINPCGCRENIQLVMRETEGGSES